MLYSTCLCLKQPLHPNHDETRNERLVADSDDESAHLRIDRSEARRWEMMSSCPCEGMQWRSWTANSRIGSMMRHLK